MARSLAVMELELSGSANMAEFSGKRGLGDEIEDVADGLVLSDLTSQTHEENLNLPNGYMSIIERLRRAAMTRVGRLSVLVAMSGPALALSACGGAENQVGPGENLPGSTAGANGAGGGDLLTDGDTIIITRAGCVVTNDAASLEAYAHLSAQDQENCQDDIANLPADKIEKLSPISQARWMAYYRKQKLGMPASMFDIDLKSYESVFKEEASRNGLSSAMLLLHQNNVAAMAWYMQQPTGAGDDPRTRWALFGPGTDAESDSIKDAAAFKNALPTHGKSLEDYVNAAGSIHALYDNGSVTDIAAKQAPGGGWEYSFTAIRTDNGQKRTFHYHYLPYLGDDGTALGNGDMHEVISQDAQFLGRNLTALPMPA